MSLSSCLAALDLLEKMLVFDPRRRISAAAGLAHEYLAPHHDSSDEPVAAGVFDWSFNDEDLPVDRWKVMIYSEVLGECMHPYDPTLYLQRVRKRPTFAVERSLMLT